MATLNQLESLRIFRAIVEAGNFTAAAQRLNCTPAWVSKTVNRLEAELDNTLLQRSTRHIRLTSAGERCYQHAVQLLDGWKALEDDLSQDRQLAAGKVRISMPMSWGLSYFAGMATRFMQQYPDIELDAQLGDEFVSVQEERYDLVLRLASELSDSSLICQRLATYQHIACAAPAYIERHGQPATPTDIARHRCLVFCRGAQISPWRFNDGQVVYPPTRMQSNNSLLLREALVAGEGIALIPEFLVTEDIKLGRLAPVLREYQSPPLHLYALMVKMPHRPYPLQLFRQFLRQQLAGA
uniref:LysR family transcriptional regulator n=1 Tax=Marinobacterium profundum TaxID=1714300 RepID=UPI00082CD53E|nr:LysR family transcriptional regulator [Marinobacterium profundum]